jgi:hypothetical protein
MENTNLIYSLFSIQGSVSRKTFTITGFVLFAIKYNIDRLIAIAYQKSWFITDYFMQADHLTISDLSSIDQKFYLTIILISIPFIWLGTVLCLKRLRNAGLNLWLVCLFFVPLINILFFFILCILPDAKNEKGKNTKPYFLNRIIPRSKTGSIIFSFLVTLIIALLFSVLSVDILQEYGWGLFVALPFFIGFSSVLLYAYHHHPLSRGIAISIGITSISFFSILILALAFEGAICIAMAAPFAYPLSIIGALLGYAIQSHTPKASFNCVAIYVLILPVIMLLEKRENIEAPVYELQTAIVIEEAPQKVWDHLVDFSTIAPPEEWLFKTGIAYPIDAKIDGKGVGAIRRCNFTTGSFVEPITIWNEPRLLKFNVLEQPEPMVELSIYDEVKTLHLDNYFLTTSGQFKLTPIGNDRTLLEGTTWYKNKMWPLAYWKQWSDFILHKIHYRVLNHIKNESEI